jgi:hypothetical protein
MPNPPKPTKKRLSRAEKKEAVAIVIQPKHKKASKRRNIFTFAAIALVVLLVAGTIFFLLAVMPMQRSILTVGDDNISVSYLLKRTVANTNGTVSSTLQLLSAETIIKQQAAAEGVAPVTRQDIDTYLRNNAKGTNDTINDTEYKIWFKEQLVTTGLSASEYRDVAARNIQRERLTDILAVDVQKVAPQVHLWVMVLSTQDAAAAAKARIDAGEVWDVVANDTMGTTTGGDYGWTPPGIFDSQLEPTISALDVGTYSDPIAYTYSDSSSSTGATTRYVLLMVSEKSDAMEMTDNQFATLKNNKLNEWLDTQSSTVTITFHGLDGSTTLDSVTSTWLNSEVQKLLTKRPSTTTTPATTTAATTTAETTAPTTEAATTTPAPATATAP